MLAKISLLSFYIFGLTYPLCFWISHRDPLKNNFHHFHVGLPTIIFGLSVVGLWSTPISADLKFSSFVCVVLFLVFCYRYWKEETVKPLFLTIVCLLGLKVFGQIYFELVRANLLEVVVSILGGLVLSAAFYAMNLGHWYLNVHGLSLTHLKRATIVLAVLLAIRLVWNIFSVPTATVMYGGEEVTLLKFMTTLDGFLLWVAIFFGSLFPLIGIYYVWGTLKVKNTQSATGILYVLLSAVLLGDLAYKYYLIRFGIAL